MAQNCRWDTRDFDYLTPLENLSPPNHVFPTDHIYIQVLRGGANIVSPLDGWVTAMAVDKRESDDYTDYFVAIQPYKEVTVRLGHLRNLTTDFQSMFDKAEKQEFGCDTKVVDGNRIGWCSYGVRLKIPAGFVLAIVGAQGQNGIDFGTHDTRKPLIDPWIVRKSLRKVDPNLPLRRKAYLRIEARYYGSTLFRMFLFLRVSLSTLERFLLLLNPTLLPSPPTRHQ